MADIKKFEEGLKKAKVDEKIIEQILSVDYVKSDDKYQDSADFYYKALEKCQELLDFDTLAKVMQHKACCKSGYRLSNARNLNKEHGNKSLEERVKLLGTLKHMGDPSINEKGQIVTNGISCDTVEKCPCWVLKDKTPRYGDMPLSYCLCCGGHFMFHYQKALGVKLKIIEVQSSILNSNGEKSCVFIYDVI